MSHTLVKTYTATNFLKAHNKRCWNFFQPWTTRSRSVEALKRIFCLDLGRDVSGLLWMRVCVEKWIQVKIKQMDHNTDWVASYSKDHSWKLQFLNCQTQNIYKYEVVVRFWSKCYLVSLFHVSVDEHQASHVYECWTVSWSFLLLSSERVAPK